MSEEGRQRDMVKCSKFRREVTNVTGSAEETKGIFLLMTTPWVYY